MEPPSRRLLCCCDACAVLFSGQSSARFRQVPKRIESWPDFHLTGLQWEMLSIPINLAFFYRSSPAQRVVALYPSPAGATESQLPPDSWDQLVNENPRLKELEPDVEALLVNRVGQAREYYRVPIDEAFKLVGILHLHWRGLSGGAKVWEEIKRFCIDLQGRAISSPGGSHA